MSTYKIELFGKDHLWLAETKLSSAAVYDLECAGYTVTPVENCYDEEEFEYLIEEE